MPGKLNVALVATRWQWEVMGLGYGPWPPDGAGIQQITPWLGWEPMQECPEGLLEMASVTPSSYRGENWDQSSVCGGGSEVFHGNEGWRPGFLTLSPAWLLSQHGDDFLTFSQDLLWRPEVSTVFLFMNLPRLKSLKNAHEYHLSLTV